MASVPLKNRYGGSAVAGAAVEGGAPTRTVERRTARTHGTASAPPAPGQ